MSLSDIDQICNAFSSILKDVYHERIEYPKVEKYAVQSGNKTSEPAKPEDENEKDAENITASETDGAENGDRTMEETSGNAGQHRNEDAESAD